MVDREVLPAVVFDLAQRVPQFLWIGVVVDARIGIDVSQREDLECASFFAADNAAGLIRRVAACLCNELLELLMG